jgi:catechol 2,3-dioxygenase-like lactoylglutathione lyase family enzyme
VIFKRIAHVCLGVKDVDRSIAYYEKLGLGIRFRFTRKGSKFGAYMEVSPGSYVEMFEDPSMGPLVNNGILHFCLETDDIDAAVARLTELGVPVTPKKLGVDNSWQAWLEDPDGNKIEIHQYTPASTQFTGGTVEADW